jgi:hypothetical protein
MIAVVNNVRAARIDVIDRAGQTLTAREAKEKSEVRLDEE